MKSEIMNGRTVDKIIADKKRGIDCTETESVLLIETARQLGKSIRHKDKQLMQAIERWFPLEWITARRRQIERRK